MAADKAAAPYPLTAYTAADKLFSARLPDGWQVDEGLRVTPGAFFFGFRDSISVSFYRAANPADDARQHLSAQTLRSTIPVPIPLPLAADKKPKPNRPAVAGHEAWETSFVTTSPPMMHNIPKQQFMERVVVVVMKTGFFSLRASCRLPEPCTWEDFEAFLASFRPGSAVL